MEIDFRHYEPECLNYLCSVHKFMKKIAAFLLLLAFSLQTFSQGLTLLVFYRQQAYIKANLCENRYRPMLHCDGKCILAKKLKAQENREQQNPEMKLSAKNEVLSAFRQHHFGISRPEHQPVHARPVSDNRTTDRPSSHFHPPGR